MGVGAMAPSWGQKRPLPQFLCGINDAHRPRLLLSSLSLFSPCCLNCHLASLLLFGVIITIIAIVAIVAIVAVVAIVTAALFAPVTVAPAAVTVALAVVAA